MRGLALAAAIVALLGAEALAASFTLGDAEQQAAIRAGERSITTEAFDREWRVDGNGESAMVLTPFHRLMVAARHAAFKNETVTPAEVRRVLKLHAGRLVMSVELRGRSEDFARYLVPRLLVGTREITPSFVQNERTPARRGDSVWVAHCMYGFPIQDLKGRDRVTLRVADTEGREVSRFTIDLAAMR